MSYIKRFAEEQAEAKGLTFEEYMSEDDYELPDDWEPDFSGGSDIRELQSLWKTLK